MLLDVLHDHVIICMYIAVLRAYVQKMCMHAHSHFIFVGNANTLIIIKQNKKCCRCVVCMYTLKYVFEFKFNRAVYITF